MSTKDSYRTKFLMQRSNAKTRGVKFKLTYEQWRAVWGRQITKRGRKVGQFVMARRDDCGAYELGNIEIITSSQNAKDQQCNLAAQVKEFKRLIKKLEAEQKLLEYFA